MDSGRFSVLVVEDEVMAARRLQRLVAEHWGDRLRSIEICEDLPCAVARLAAGPCDLMLLDLDLRGDDGFRLTDLAGHAAVIVVSAQIQRAIDAFGHQVLDFVPKPVASERLGLALRRFEAWFDRAERWLTVVNAGRAERVPLNRIAAIATADDYVELRLADGAVLLHDQSMAALEEQLTGRFLRVHRCFAVNLDRVAALERDGRSLAVVLEDGARVPVSRHRAAMVSQRFRETR